MSKTAEGFKKLISEVKSLRNQEKLIIKCFEASTCELAELFHVIIECELSGMKSYSFNLEICPEIYARALQEMGFVVTEHYNHLDILIGYDVYWGNL